MEGRSGAVAIRVRGLRKSFGTERVLTGVDLEVAQGETLAVVGRSGAGKSVLLKLMIGLQRPDDGEIEMNGEQITHLSLDELNRVRRKVGFLFQNSALYDSLTVEENVAFPLRRHTKMKDSEIKDRVRELLASVGMEDASAKMPGQLSGGMQRRVGLARAVSLDPEIVLLDEPTTALDPITASEVNNLIRELQSDRDVSSVLVTHDMRSVEMVADRVAMLDGNIVVEGTLEQMRQSEHPLLSKFLQESWR
jgi:phospholipid/cholesterol/gamma-HCH transport system ATP-binding protein